MKNSALVVFLVSALVVVSLVTAQSTFVHPGISHKLSDLERIKHMVDTQIDPWFSSYQEMAADSKASFDYEVQGNPSFTVLARDSPRTNYGAWNSDIRAAYYNAIRWYVTGDSRHADKAVEIFSAWSNLTSVTSNGTDALSGGVGYIMIEAAEIIQSTYDGWSDADIDAFKDMLVYPGYSNTLEPTGDTTFYWMSFQGDPGRHGNQGLSGWRTVMAMGVFLDNEIMYDRALRYIQGLPHRADDLPYPPGPRNSTSLIASDDYADSYNTSLSTSIEDYGYNELMTNYIWENGQCQESSRDQQHTFFGIGILCSMSEIAWNQGTDLYSHANDRLLLGLEYNMRYNVSAIRSYPDQTDPWEPTVESGEFIQRFDRTGRWYSKAISPIGRAGFPDTRPVFEMPLAHYQGRGLKTAEETKWIARARDIAIEESGYEVAGWTNDAIGWGALTARRPDHCYGDPISGFSSGQPDYAMNVLPAVIEAENFDYFTTSGEGLTYHDSTTVNSGGLYRLSEGVDIDLCSEGGYALTSLEDGEWLTYTVAVPSTGRYDIEIRYAASQAGGKIKFSFGETDKTREVFVPFGAPDSSGSSDWKSFSVARSVLLDKGVQSMKVSIAGTSNAFLLNNISVSRDPNALVGHWKFEESSGAMIADSSGNGHDGTNDSADPTSGIDGGALSFDGESSVITLPASAFESVSDEVTVAMWVKGSEQQPVEGSVFSASVGSSRALNIHLPWSDSNVYWDAGYDAGYDRINQFADSSQYEGDWNHWAFTKDTTTGTMRVYHNGNLWHSGAGHTRSMSGISSGRIGGELNGAYYHGAIDDVQLYDVALSEKEIASLYYKYPVFGVSGLAANATGATQVDLVWNTLADATSYNLKRSLTSGGPYALLAGGLTTPSFVDAGLSTGTSYYYVLSANYDGIESGDSSEVIAVPVAVTGTAPVITTTSIASGTTGVPYQQAIVAVDGEGSLSWSLSSGELPLGISLGLDGILRGTASTAGTENFSVKVVDADGDIDTQALSLTIYNPGEAPPDQFSVSNDGVTASSFQDPNIPTNTIDGDLGERWSARGSGEWIRYDLGLEKELKYLRIAWLNGDSRTSSFEIEVSNDDSTWTSVTGGIVESSGETAELETVDVTDVFARYVRIVGYGNSTDNGWNSILEVEFWGAESPAPLPPLNLVAIPDNGQIVLNWSASDGATSYHLKRSTTSGSGYATISSGQGESHLDSTVMNGTVYYYVVSAESLAGESADSLEAYAKPFSPITSAEMVTPMMALSESGISLTMETFPGRVYQLQRSTTLDLDDWHDVGEPLIGTGVSMELSDQDITPATERFYRIEIQP